MLVLLIVKNLVSLRKKIKKFPERTSGKHYEGGVLMNNSNLMWVRYKSETGPNVERYILLKKNGTPYSYLEIPFREIPSVLKLEIERYGLKCEYKWYGEPGKYHVFNNKEPKKITVTAPLYECKWSGCISSTVEYMPTGEEYTGETLCFSEYELAKEIFGKCKEEVANSQRKRFKEIFMSQSLDNGKTAILRIANVNYDKPLDDNTIYEMYIPSGYIKMFEFRDWNADATVVGFIKKIDAHGKPVKIIVPEKYKGHVIGKKRVNINRIAEQINASCIRVK